MQYVKVSFPADSQETRDVLAALLSDIGFAGFEETDHSLLAYVGEEDLDEGELRSIAIMTGTTYQLETVANQNWNAVWESNFPPVIVDDFCTIRAHFHEIPVHTPYEILITPKMSFGTGHHATTQLMMLMMKDIDFVNKTVLDFGTGTGVLAILAEKLGSTKILAIDNDEWCVENATENIERNSCRHISVKQGSLEAAAGFIADVVLANINRHILLEYMSSIFGLLSAGGTILMSGLLTEDEHIIREAAERVGLRYQRTDTRQNWISLAFVKS